MTRADAIEAFSDLNLRDYAVASLAWLTLADLMEITGFSRDKVTSLIKTGEIPAVKIGGEYRISQKAWRRAEQKLIGG